MPSKLLAFDLTDQAVELIANLFKALSEPNRLRLLIALEAGEKNVSELVEATKLTQANVSRHLQTLINAGILSRRKEGLAVIYSICDPMIFDLCEQVCGSVKKRLQQQAKAFGGAR